MMLYDEVISSKVLLKWDTRVLDTDGEKTQWLVKFVQPNSSSTVLCGLWTYLGWFRFK